MTFLNQITSGDDKEGNRLVIYGMEGVGKTTLAYHIAHHALSGGSNQAGNIDLNHRVAKLITAEAHPDMLVVRRAADEKTGELRSVIVVEDALKIASFLHKTSTHGGWRVVIIDEAHHLNRFGMNAILKMLEEPPPRTLILITVTTPGVLLPTIRSRCRILQLSPLNSECMLKLLMRHKPDLKEHDVTQLIELSSAQTFPGCVRCRTFRGLTLFGGPVPASAELRDGQMCHPSRTGWSGARSPDRRRRRG